MWQKSPIETKELSPTCVTKKSPIKRALQVCQTRPTYTPKEPYVRGKRALHMWQRSPAHVTEEPHRDKQIEPYMCDQKKPYKKNPTSMPNETYIYAQRALQAW